MDFWFSVLNTIDGDYWSQFKYCYLIALSLSLFCLRYDAFYRLLFISLISDEMPSLTVSHSNNKYWKQSKHIFDATNGMCNITYRFAYIGHDEWIFQQLFNKICFNSVTYFTFTSSAKYRVLPLKKRTNNWKICIFWREIEKTQSFCLNRKKNYFVNLIHNSVENICLFMKKSRNN